MVSPKRSDALYFPPFRPSSSPHRPTPRFLRIRRNGASCSSNRIMPNNRSIEAHLLHPRASITIPGPSNAFIEEAHVHQRKRLVARGSSVPSHRVLEPLVDTGNLFPIIRPTAVTRRLRDLIDTISRASSREVAPRKVVRDPDSWGFFARSRVRDATSPADVTRVFRETNRIRLSLALLSFCTERMFL